MGDGSIVLMLEGEKARLIVEKENVYFFVP
jgi:hypothetical protein